MKEETALKLGVAGLVAAVVAIIIVVIALGDGGHCEEFDTHRVGKTNVVTCDD